MLILSTLFISVLALFLYSIMQDTGINTKYARRAGNGMNESVYVDDEPVIMKASDSKTSQMK